MANNILLHLTPKTKAHRSGPISQPSLLSREPDKVH
jgi:hypothetical protein